MNRRIGAVFISICIGFLIIIVHIHALAMDTGFETEKLSEETVNEIKSNMKITVLHAEPPKGVITCFDISERGNIAVGSEKDAEKTIYVYSSDMMFLYAYQFETVGDFVIEWDRDTMNVVLVRGNMIMSLSSDGFVEDVCQIIYKAENSAYLESLRSNAKHQGVYRYQALNQGISFSTTNWTTLVRTGETGEKEIVYQMQDPLKPTAIYLAFLAMFIIGIIMIPRKLMKQRNP